MPDDIHINEERLDERLKKEAERRSEDVDQTRKKLLWSALDAAKQERDRVRQQGENEVDVLLVTATQTEHEQLEEEVREQGLGFDKRSHGGGTYYHLGKIGDARVASFRVGMGSFGSMGSAAGCIRARAATKATSLILLGTAFGVDRSTQRIGDILVSDSVFLYDDRDIRDDQNQAEGYIISYRSPPPLRYANPTWVKRFGQMAAENLRLGEAERISVGVLLSGGARIESARFRDKLVHEYAPCMTSPIIGGEMEAAGAVAASDPGSAGEPGIWVVVKGVVDFADASSRAKELLEENRTRAARASARAVLRVLRMSSQLS